MRACVCVCAPGCGCKCNFDRIVAVDSKASTSGCIMEGRGCVLGSSLSVYVSVKLSVSAVTLIGDSANSLVLEPME